MKEEKIRKKTIELLENEGWVVWYPYKTRWQKHKDIFGVYDLIAAKGEEIKFIQLTTFKNVPARVKKIRKFLNENNLNLFSRSEV